MNLSNLVAIPRPARMALGLSVAVAALGIYFADAAFAQQPQPQQQRPQQQPQRQQQQRPQQQRPAQQTPQPPAQQAPAQPPSAETPPLIYSPWTKVCGKEGPQGAPQKEVCFTIKEARLDTGQFVASAGLIELEGDQKKLLRVTLPLGLLLRHGTRMIVDANQPMTGTYNFCLPNGCWADFEVSPEFVKSLKSGNNLVLQAFNLNGQVATFGFPLADFAKSNEGPPTDPKALEEQQKKLQEELQRRAEEARKRLEQGGGGGQPQQQPQPPR